MTPSLTQRRDGDQDDGLCSLFMLYTINEYEIYLHFLKMSGNTSRYHTQPAILVPDVSDLAGQVREWQSPAQILLFYNMLCNTWEGSEPQLPRVKNSL